MAQPENVSIQGRLPGNRVHLENGSQRVLIANSKDSCEPTINVVRQSGVITSIEVACSCGKITRLECEYDEPTSVTT